MNILNSASVLDENTVGINVNSTQLVSSSFQSESKVQTWIHYGIEFDIQ